VVSAVASDAQGRTAPVQTNINVTGTLPDEDPLIFGNPSNATPDVSNETNYLMPKAQYTLSYHRNKGEPNWVAWRLDSSWIGGAPRQDDYRPDPALPAAWYHVQDNDYSGSGYQRGHMCPSGDRTRSVPDNSATFLMTNFLPQIGPNNEGPWADLENYCRTLASQGNEMYIIAGGWGNAGTIANGHVQVPTVTWKVVLVLPNGSNDVSRVNRNTRAFGVIMSNVSISQTAPWRNFRTTVNAVEYLTGYDFFSAIPKNTQELIERQRDKL
jgi:endonuclease G